MDLHQLQECLERLEKVVFDEGESDRLAIESASEGTISTDDKMTILMQTAKVLKPWSKELAKDNKLFVQAVAVPEHQHLVYMQFSQLSTLVKEETDKSIAKLCGVLSSHQRIAMLHLLITAFHRNLFYDDRQLATELGG